MSGQPSPTLNVPWATGKSGCIGIVCLIAALFFIMHGIIEPMMDEDGSRRARGFAAILNSMVYNNIGVGQLLVGGLLGLEAARQLVRVSDKFALRANDWGLSVGRDRASWENVDVVERRISTGLAPYKLVVRYRISPEKRLRTKLFRTIDFEAPDTASFLELAEAKGKLAGPAL